jgi:hypothetical protein
MPENVKPIIFSGPMVRALLEGRKTQTRRVLKPQIVCSTGIMPSFSWGKFSGLFPDDWFGHGNEIDGALPYLPGDLLYVRESWAARLDEDHIQPHDLTRSTAFFWADGPAYCCNTGCNGAAGRVRAAMHLPRRLSRITLEVTDVRIQRLQEISEEDAEAEGTYSRGSFATLWDHLNAKRGFGWDANPWVAAVTFKVHNVNVDEFLKAREAA